MTGTALQYSKRQGNDLVTPRPDIGFPGLTPGDPWRVRLPPWVEALAADVAPPVVPEATTEAALGDVSLTTLNAHEYDPEAPGWCSRGLGSPDAGGRVVLALAYPRCCSRASASDQKKA